MSIFNSFTRDIAKFLPERFSAWGKERKALSNTSTNVIYDSATSTELTLLCLHSENNDLQVGDKITFQNKQYQVYQTQRESRVMIRIFLKEEHIYV